MKPLTCIIVGGNVYKGGNETAKKKFHSKKNDYATVYRIAQLY